MSAARPWVLGETNYAAVRGRKWEVAVLPFGATEPHNLHMPYATDTLQVSTVAERACEFAHGRGAAVIALPTLPFGVNTNHFGIPNGFACSLNPTTLYAVIGDLVDSLVRFGVRKVLLLNGHGGNELKPALRELMPRTPAKLFLCDWYRVGRDRFGEIFERAGEHADEMETSMGLAFFPGLIEMEKAGSGAEKPTRFEAVRRGWVSHTRPWHLATADTGIGNPSAATADKGRELMELVVERIGSFLVELAAAELDEKFPY